MTTKFTVFTSNAGHSAKAPGAAANGYKEHEQARLCNDAFIKVMKAHGHSVTDTTSDGKNRYIVLEEQAAKANKVNAGDRQIDLSFHLNAGGGTGVEVFYYGDDAKMLAGTVSSAIATTLGVKNRGAKKSQELYFLKNTKATALLIEVCFIDSASDMEKLVAKRAEAMTAVAEVLVGPFRSSSGSSTGAFKGSSTDSSTPSTATPPPVPKSAYAGSSVVDYLKSIGYESSFSNRAKLAVTYGVVQAESHYHGTAAQNSQLLAAMKEREQ